VWWVTGGVGLALEARLNAVFHFLSDGVVHRVHIPAAREQFVEGVHDGAGFDGDGDGIGHGVIS